MHQLRLKLWSQLQAYLRILKWKGWLKKLWIYKCLTISSAAKNKGINTFLGIDFFFNYLHLLFPIFIWTFIFLFSLNFYFPFFWDFYFPFSLWTFISLFSLDFYSIAVTFWISSKFFHLLKEKLRASLENCSKINKRRTYWLIRDLNVRKFQKQSVVLISSKKINNLSPGSCIMCLYFLIAGTLEAVVDLRPITSEPSVKNLLLNVEADLARARLKSTTCGEPD